MGKLLSKRISSVLVKLFVLIFVLFSFWIVSMAKKDAFRELEVTIEQIEESYDINKREAEVSIELVKEDYLNRAYAVEFLLSNYVNHSKDYMALSKIKELMELETINLIDVTGTIVLSSEESSIGLALKEHKDAEPFLELLNSEDEKAYVVQMDAVSILLEEPQIYIGVKSSAEEYGVVQIGLDPKVITDVVAKNSLKSVVNNTTTLKSRAAFVYDPEVGEIVGITRNNESQVEFEDTYTKEKYLEVLKKAEKGSLVKINGSLKFLKTKEIEGKIVGAYIDIHAVYKLILGTITYCFLITLLVFACVMIIFRHHIKKYIIRDLLSIASKIRVLVSGNYGVTFETKYPTELREIADVLNDWKSSYKHKSDRMTRIITSLNRNVAIFECLYSINQNFFSDNMQKILGVDDTLWDEIKNTPKEFEHYVNTLLLTARGQENAIEISQKIVSIISYKEEDQFYGIIVDKTEEIYMKNRIQQELHDVQIESETDPLTRLRNRAGLEKHIKERLASNRDKGIMLIFDLDNFKSINDELGHPEGDTVLKIFANCLITSFRKNDVIGRIGGDEFIVFIEANVPVKVIEEKLEFFIKEVHRNLNVYHKRFGLSTSIGVAYVDNVTYSYEDLYKCADVALYMAKRLGKDRFYINEENIRCMRNNCIKCTKNCRKRADRITEEGKIS